MNEILIYGDIGWENTARQVEGQLKEFNGEPVKVRVNSGGGDVYEGVAILNALRGYSGEVITVVESLAASAASFIAVGAGSKVIIRPNAELMIHKAWTMMAGNADDVDKVKIDLARQDVKIAGIYADRAGGELDDWLALMSAETWYSAQEALDAGLVDEIEDAKQPADTLADAVNQKVFAQFKYSSRSSAPPPMLVGSRSVSVPEPTTRPSDGQEGEAMSFLNKLAQSMGMTPEEVQNELSGLFNEKVTVSGEVEVTYPADTPIVPTEKITVEPIIGDAPAEGEDPEGGPAPAQNAVGDGGAAAGLGLIFEVGDAPDGWTASVDAESGAVTVKAPSGAEVESTVEIPVTVNGTDVPLTLKVRGLSDDDEPVGGDEPAGGAAPTNSVVPKGMSLVPTDHLDYLNKTVANFGEQQAKLDEKADHDRVDKDIADGRFSVANRAKALGVRQSNPQLYEETWGSMRKGTINRGESGYSRAEVKETVNGSADMPSVDELRQRAAGRVNKKGSK